MNRETERERERARAFERTLAGGEMTPSPLRNGGAAAAAAFFSDAFFSAAFVTSSMKRGRKSKTILWSPGAQVS